MNTPQELTVTQVVQHGRFTFAETETGERIYVPVAASSDVIRLDGKSTFGNNGIRHPLSKGDVIMALVIPGSKPDHCRQAGAWAPISVWDPKEAENPGESKNSAEGGKHDLILPTKAPLPHLQSVIGFIPDSAKAPQKNKPDAVTIVFSPNDGSYYRVMVPVSRIIGGKIRHAGWREEAKGRLSELVTKKFPHGAELERRLDSTRWEPVLNDLLAEAKAALQPQ